MTAIPTKIPPQFISGDTVKFLISAPDYPAPTWTLTYYFNSRAFQKTIVATASDTDHLIQITAAVSEEFTPGMYSYQAKAYDGTDKYTIFQGRIEVLPNGSAELQDALTIAENIVAKVDEAILNRVTEDFIEIWTEEGRKLIANSLPDLMAVRTQAVNTISLEKEKRDRAAGRKSSRAILTQFK